MIRAISQSHSTESSYAFFMTPNLRLLNVTYSRLERHLLVLLLIFFKMYKITQKNIMRNIDYLININVNYG